MTQAQTRPTENAIHSAVITGANGMLGSALARELLGRNIPVLALVRSHTDGTPSRGNLPQHPLLTVAVCDLSELAEFRMPQGALPDLADTQVLPTILAVAGGSSVAAGEATIKGSTAPAKKNTATAPKAIHAPAAVSSHHRIFYHFAWSGTYGASRDDAVLQSQNIHYTLDAISLAARLHCTHFVGAGTQAEYGPVPDGEKLAPTTSTNPQTGYGIAKLAAGGLGKLYASQLGLHFSWVRIVSVYGPGDKPYCLTMSTIRALLKGEAVHFTGGGQQWDFLYCGDAARAFRLIGESGVDGQTYVLGSGRTIPLAEALTTLCHAVDPSARVGLGDLPYPPGQRMYLCADISKLTGDTGFVPTTTFAEGIQQTIQWVKEHERL